MTISTEKVGKKAKAANKDALNELGRALARGEIGPELVREAKEAAESQARGLIPQVACCRRGRATLTAAAALLLLLESFRERSGRWREAAFEAAEEVTRTVSGGTPYLFPVRFSQNGPGIGVCLGGIVTLSLGVTTLVEEGFGPSAREIVREALRESLGFRRLRPEVGLLSGLEEWSGWLEVSDALD